MSSSSQSVSGSPRVVSGHEAAQLLAHALLQSNGLRSVDRMEPTGPIGQRVRPVTDGLRQAGDALGDTARGMGNGARDITKAVGNTVVVGMSESATFGVEVAQIGSDAFTKVVQSANNHFQRTCEVTKDEITKARDGGLVLVDHASRVPEIMGHVSGDLIAGSTSMLAGGIDSIAWSGDTLIITVKDGSQIAIENAEKLLDETAKIVGGVWDLSRLLVRKTGNIAGHLMHGALHTGTHVVASILDQGGDVAERFGHDVNELGDDLSRRLSSSLTEDPNA